MAEVREFLRLLDEFLDKRTQPITQQLTSNTETLSLVLRNITQMQTVKKPLKIELSEDNTIEVHRPQTADNRRRVEFLKAEESRKRKEDEDRRKEEAKIKRGEEERKKEEAKKKLTEGKGAKEVTRTKFAEELAKKKEAEKQAKQQKEEEAKRERMRKDEEIRAKKEEEKKQKEAERLRREEELAKRREAERLKKEEAKKVETKKEEAKKRGVKPPPLKQGLTKDLRSSSQPISQSSGSSQPLSASQVVPPESTRHVRLSDIDLPDADGKLSKFSDDENLLLDRTEELMRDPLTEEIANMERTYSQEQLSRVKPFSLSLGANGALKLIGSLSDSEFFTDTPINADVLFALRLFEQLRGTSLPTDDEAAWTQCQATLRQWFERKFALSVEVTKAFNNDLLFSDENIDKVEKLLRGRTERVDPGQYGDSCALLGILMFPLKDAVAHCGLIPDKVDPARKYQRLLHKKKLLEGGY